MNSQTGTKKWGHVRRNLLSVGPAAPSGPKTEGSLKQKSLLITVLEMITALFFNLLLEKNCVKIFKTKERNQ